MKKTVKLLLIFMVSILVILVGGIGGYSLIMSNQTFYIYDLRFVEPKKNERGYIYTKSNTNYKTMPSSKVYLKTSEENYLPIAVYVSTSNGNTDIDISSSNESVAKIEYRQNKCYVKYLKAGEATITTTMGPIKDSFKLEVYESIPSEFRVYDNAYYGASYAKKEKYVNKLVCYYDQDNLTYQYDYELFDTLGSLNDELLNSGLLEVDQSSFDSGYFEKISLDGKNKILNLTLNSTDIPSSVHTSIAIKSYLIENGKKRLHDIFEIDVYIIVNEVEYVQIEVSTNPDFTDNCVFLNIDKVNYSDDLGDKLLDYLACQRVESNLEIANEKATYNLFITEKTPQIYMKFRLVYTNGTIKELNKSNMNELYHIYLDDVMMDKANNYLNLDENNFLECEPQGEFFILQLQKDYLIANDNKVELKFDFLGELIDLELNDAVNNLKTFSIQYLDLTDIDDIKKLYVQNEDGTYTYSYWDKRTIINNVVYDSNKNIVGFLD